MAGASLAFNIIARDKASGVLSKIGNETEKTHGRFSKLGSTLATGLKWGAVAAGGAAIGGIGAVLKVGVGEVSDYQKGLAQLQQGLKTTGNVAGISAQGMEDLASKIEGYSGQTDDSIVATEQLLLTFTNIRNTAGKNNDVFTQTTKIAADMAARMGGDASGAAIQLGKALNDPVKGVTALSRVGVSFTDGQKKQIKALVDSGKTMDAQKVILKELNKEFGGSAKAVGNTLPGQIEKAKRTFEGFAQNIATAVLPLLLKLGGFIGKTLSPVFGAISKAVTIFFDALTGKSELNEFDGALKTMNNAGVRLAQFFRTQLVPAFGVIVAVIQTKLLPAWRQIGQFIATNVLPILQAVAGFIVANVVPAVMRLASVFIGAFRGALRRINAAIAGHRQQLTGIFHALRTVAAFVLKVAVPVIGTALKIAFRVLGTAISAAITIISGIYTAIHGIVRVSATVISWIRQHWQLLAAILFGPWGIAIKVIHDHFDAIVGFARAIPGRIKKVFSNVGTLLIHAGEQVIEGFINGIKNKFGDVKNTLGGLTNKLTSWKGPPAKDLRILYRNGRYVIQGFISGLKAETPAVKAYLKKFTDGIAAEVAKANARIAAARQNLASVRADKRQFASGIASGLSGDLSGAFDSEGKLGSVTGFLSSTASGLKRFAGQLRKLKRLGLGARLLSQIADLGVEQGGQVAAQLLAGGAAGITAANTAESQIAKFSGQAGQTVANATFAHREAKAEKHLADIRASAHHQIVLLREIARKVGAHPDAPTITRELRRYKRLTGHSLGLA